MKIRFLAIVLSISCLLLAACGEKSEYNKAREADSLETYENFLTKYPNSEYAEEVKDKILTLTYEQVKKDATIEAYEGFLTKYPNSEYAEEVNEMLTLTQDTQINKLLSLVGTPDEFSIIPMDSTNVNVDELMDEAKFVLKYISEIGNSLRTGIAKGNFTQLMNKHSEFLRVKYWNFSIKDSSFKYLNISEVQKRLGKENSIEKGEFETNNSKFSVLWYKYDWICFGVDDSSKIRAVRGIYNYPKRPYIRLKNNKTIEASFEPGLLLFQDTNSVFYMLSSESIRSIVRVPTNNSQNNTSIPMYVLEHDPTKIIITKVSKEVLNKPDFIEYVYEILEGQYNAPSGLGQYWMIAGKDRISGTTHEKAEVKRWNFFAFAETTLIIKDRTGDVKDIPVSDFISFFR